jgi:cyclophilin family peptidyl-prolyl cis-trans isomerase
MKKVLFILAVLLILGCKGEDTMKNRYAYFETSMGNFKVELYEDKAPITTKNFIDLANKGYYNGLIFHRVMENFMIQGGDPNGDGSGGPGYVIQDEFSPSLKHDNPGILSMANRGPNTGGSQFFITVVQTPWLDGKHAVFGKVAEGYDVVEAISKVPVDKNSKPLTDVVIKKITIK